MAAIAISCLGIAVAVAVNLWKPEGSLLWMMSVSMLGAMFTWFMIFVTHLFSARAGRASIQASACSSACGAIRCSRWPAPR